MSRTKWRKLGHLLAASGQTPWMQAYASNPTAEPLANGNVRIYFSSRDERNRSHIGAAVFELEPHPRLLDLTPDALVAPGEPGAFDDSGASMCALVRREDALWLYYLGWNLCVTVPWRNSIGLAVSRDGGRSFEKHSPAPVLDRSRSDPYSISYPCVIFEGTEWRMWYGSQLTPGTALRHALKAARSSDGISWERDPVPILPFASAAEYAMARPCVLRDPDRYRLWFTHRGHSYRLGYAESLDGRTWLRDDSAVDLDISAGGEWDAEMIAYPNVFDCSGARYMLYNGNHYGKTGFGIAIADS